MADITGICVIVPARDEEELLPACLDGIAAAAREVAVPVYVVVALDKCRDASRAVVENRPGVVAVELSVGSVGAARAAAARTALDLACRHSSDQIWLASTDADSVVPSSWLSTQLSLAADGWEVVVGTVEVTDWTGHHEDVRQAWSDSYRPVDHHAHVHGASLGMTATAYLDAGGFGSEPVGEDVAIVAALAHRRIIYTAAIPVVTSARRTPRAAGGFGDHLRSLEVVPEAS